MVPQYVVEEVAARLRDCVHSEMTSTDQPHDDLDDATLELLARRATEVVTTIAQFDWPEDPETRAGAGGSPADGRSP